MPDARSNVTFPGSVTGTIELVDTATLRAVEFEHEMMTSEVIVASLPVRTGSPVRAVTTYQGESDEFVGYVHHVVDEMLDTTSRNRRIKVIMIGPTFSMKNAKQRVFVHKTVSQVAEQICKEHGLTADVEAHGHVFPSISQPGISDWEMLVRLAKTVGFVLHTHGTVVHMHSRKRNEREEMASAPVLTFINPARDRATPDQPGLIAFSPQVGETLPHAAAKGVKAAWALDPKTNQTFATTNLALNGRPARGGASGGFLTQYSRLVAHNGAESAVLLQGQADLGLYQHRAQATLVGAFLDLRVGSQVYIHNVPGDYEGYWTILGLEQITEGGLVLTHLTLGTDAIGVRRVHGPDARRKVTSTRAKAGNSILTSANLWRGTSATLTRQSPAAAVTGSRVPRASR